MSFNGTKPESNPGLGFLLIFVGLTLVVLGGVIGWGIKPETQTVYVYERFQPVKPVYSEYYPSNASSFTLERGGREYIFYYWLSPGMTTSDRPYTVLKWSYRELVGGGP